MTVVAMVAEEEEGMVAVGGEVTVEGVTELPVGVVGATVEPYERRLCVKNNFPPLNEDTVGNDEAVSEEMVLKGPTISLDSPLILEPSLDTNLRLAIW